MNIDEQIEVQVGFKSGKKIESSEKNIEFWEKDISPVWNFGIRKYRIKKEAPKRWRAEEGGYFWCICRDGSVFRSEHFGSGYTDSLYASGNYFETEEQARASAIFFILNDKYEYSFPWMEDKPEVPEVHEYWNMSLNQWEAVNYFDPNKHIVRWLKHPNEEVK